MGDDGTPTQPARHVCGLSMRLKRTMERERERDAINGTQTRSRQHEHGQGEYEPEYQFNAILNMGFVEKCLFWGLSQNLLPPIIS